MKKQIGQLPGWIVSTHFLYLFVFLFLPIACLAQVVTGSNGSDGALNPTAASTVINMATHPNGIYQYTSVNIPATVTVTFTPNANNTPVVWLVQSNVMINGTVSVSGSAAANSSGGLGGPGGYGGGNLAPSPTSGLGPGGGLPGPSGGNASYGTIGLQSAGEAGPGPTYGNQFLVPLLGGSGGGGSSSWGGGGGGGGGAILIAASGTVQVDGSISANGGVGVLENEPSSWVELGYGSGGAVRLVASKITGSGRISATGQGVGGDGRLRFDAYDNEFTGSVGGQFSSGFQPIIIPSAGQLPQLTVTSVGGVPVSASPTGVLSTPDAVLSAQENNPIPIVVQCSNLPLNTPITVSVKPMNGSPICAVCYNSTGTQASSTATVSLNMPRGGGLVYATAAAGN